MISNFGRESDYERVGVPALAEPAADGDASAHRRTGRGVEVDGCGGLVGASGSPSGLISVVGSPREGDEIVRYGRTGAFTFNLAAIKNHSVEVAATVLCRLETCYGAAAMTLTGTLTPEVAEAVSLDVRRMTARRRDDRAGLYLPPGRQACTRSGTSRSARAGYRWLTGRCVRPSPGRPRRSCGTCP